MNKPEIVKVEWSAAEGAYKVDVPNWDGGEVVLLDDIATYVEQGAILVGRVGHDLHYGPRLLKALADEIRAMSHSASRQARTDISRRLAGVTLRKTDAEAMIEKIRQVTAPEPKKRWVNCSHKNANGSPICPDCGGYAGPR